MAPSTSFTPILGDWGDMMPRSVQASLLRNSLSMLLLMYTICLVELSFPILFFPGSQRMVARRKFMSWLVCSIHLQCMGIGSFVVNPSLRMTLDLTRQLRQPVSAICHGIGEGLALRSI